MNNSCDSQPTTRVPTDVARRYGIKAKASAVAQTKGQQPSNPPDSQEPNPAASTRTATPSSGGIVRCRRPGGQLGNRFPQHVVATLPQGVSPNSDSASANSAYATTTSRRVHNPRSQLGC